MLRKFVIFDSSGPKIDWDDLSKVIRLSIRFLDNVIDANKYAVEPIKKMTYLLKKKQPRAIFPQKATLEAQPGNYRPNTVKKTTLRLP